MLEGLFGNQTIEKVLLSLFHYGEVYVAGIAKDFKIAENPIRNQLERLEQTGIIHSKFAGRTRLYSFNPKNPYTSSLKNLVEVLYYAIPLQEREQIFKSRRRPRRKGKPVL
jgi:predicted transcriptional regulator